MSGNHHDDHHYTEVKPVSFTVPFILASVLLLIIFLFLSLCDPKHGHTAEGEGHGHNAAAMEATHDDATHNATMEENHEGAEAHAAAVADSTTATATAIAPEVEGKPEEAHH